jgi:hypothetical protein
VIPLCGICQSEITFGGIDDEEAFSIITTPDQGFLVVGTTRSFGLGSEDILILKLDRSGYIQWSKTLGSSHRNRIYRTIATLDGGYALLGSGFPEVKNISDIHMVKLNQNFNLEWESYYLNTSEEEGYGIQEIADGYLISGFTREKGVGDFQVIKVDKFGTVIWDKIIGENSKDIAIGSAIREDGNYLICGMRSGFNNYSSFDFKKPNSDLMLVGLNGNTGDTLFKKIKETTEHLLLNDVLQTNDGRIFLLGSTQNNSFGSFDVWLSEINDIGEILWEKNFGAGSFDYGYSLHQHDNQLYIAGSLYSGNISKSDMYIINTNLNGEKNWERIIGGSDSEYAKDIAISNDQLVVLGQRKIIESNQSDILISFLDSLGNAKEINLTDLLSNGAVLYPNPADQELTINRLIDQIDETNDAFKYEIINDKGQVIDKLMGSNKINLQTHNYLSGKYFYRITSDKYKTVNGAFVIVH